MKSSSIFVALLLSGSGCLWAAEQRYQATGLVTAVDAPHQTVVVSHDAIPGYMEAMAMPYQVRDQKVLAELKPGMKIEFTLVVGKSSSYIADVHVPKYKSQDRSL